MNQRQQRAALALHRAQQEFDAAFAESESRSDRWRRLLTLVEDAGRPVTGAEWRAMGEACGYDARGLGGFFVGNNHSMQRNADGTSELAPAGVAFLDQAGRLR